MSLFADVGLVKVVAMLLFFLDSRCAQTRVAFIKGSVEWSSGVCVQQRVLGFLFVRVVLGRGVIGLLYSISYGGESFVQQLSLT